MRFIVTFPVGGPLRGCYTIVEADDEETARYRVIDEYTRDGFGALYSEHLGRPIVATYDLKLIPFGPLAEVLS
jgi:hypothetical protein